jgi:hypothetical protein
VSPKMGDITKVELVGTYYKHSKKAQEFRDLLIFTPTVHTGVERNVRQAQTRLSPVQVEQFKIDYGAGVTITQLSRKYAIHRNTVFEQIERSGLPRRNPRLSPVEVSEAIDLYRSGHSLVKVGKHLGVSGDTVALALTKAGETLRPRRGWTSRTP